MEREVTAGIAAPATVRWRRSERGPELTWSPVAGAESYAVQVCREASFAEPLLYAVPGLTFALPPIPGPVFVRVRGVAGGAAGPWGAVHDLSAPAGGDDPPAAAGAL